MKQPNVFFTSSVSLLLLSMCTVTYMAKINQQHSGEKRVLNDSKQQAVMGQNVKDF